MSLRLRVSILFFIVLCFCSLSSAQETNKVKSIDARDLPQEVMMSFKLAYPKNIHANYGISEDGLYCIKSAYKKKNEEACFSVDGDWVKTITTINEEELPLRVHQFIQEKYAAYKTAQSLYEQQREGKSFYWVIMNLRSNASIKTFLLFDFSGEIVSIDALPIMDSESVEAKEDLIFAKNSQKGNKTKVNRFGRVEEEPYVDTLERPLIIGAQKIKEIQRVFSEEEQMLALKESKELTKAQLAEEVEKPSRIGKDQKEGQVQKTDKTQVVDVVQPEAQIAEEVEKPRKPRKPSKENAKKVDKEQMAFKSQFDIKPGTAYKREKDEKEDEEITASDKAGLGKKKEEVRENIVNCPEIVTKVFAQRFPRAEKIVWKKDSNIYEATFNNYEQSLSAAFTYDGVHKYTAYFFTKNDIPLPIGKFFESQGKKWKYVEGKRVVYESKYKRGFPYGSRPEDYYQLVMGEKIPKQKILKCTLFLFNQNAQYELQRELNNDNASK